jgi:DNA repair protein RecN (Recombination protein N)
MIKFLSIENLAIVEKLELELESGFTVITGETGAGKSIVLGALGLLVGDRATSALLRTGAEKARVQAVIERENGNETILRREVTAQGRSRSFVDDNLTTVNALQVLGRQAIDLHGQHEHQTLLDSKNHLKLLDAFGKFRDISIEVASKFDEWRRSRDVFERARVVDENKKERIELLILQREEIDKVAPIAGEEKDLNKTLVLLGNAEKLSNLCEETYSILYERDNSIISDLGQIWRNIDELAILDSEFNQYQSTREAVEHNLEDLAFFLRSYAAGIESSSDKLIDIETRLAEIERLKKKHGPELENVIEFRKKIEEELDELANGSRLLDRLAQAELVSRNSYLEKSKELSKRRHRAGDLFSGELVSVLVDLAIPSASFEVSFESHIESEERWSESGLDSGEFYFSANPGETPRPLAKVASGGELSRIMLGIKTIASTDKIGKTLVFDEVDAGIGGAAADQVGKRLKKLGETFQVLCVTHLPQIAAYATNHYNVSKATSGKRTRATIKKLREESRVSEIARLMTGGESKEAKTSARALLNGK